MPADRFETLVLHEPLPPGATAVYRLPGRDRFHPDPDCHYLSPTSALGGHVVDVYTLATAVTWAPWRVRPCHHCSADLDVLRAVVRLFDELAPDAVYQSGLADALEVADGE